MGAAVIGKIVGTAINMGGAAVAGKANEASYEAAGEIAVLNADSAKQKFIVDKQKLERDIAHQIGSQIANTGASGLAFTGSALDMLAESETFAALDMETLRYNSDLAIAGFKFEEELAIHGERQAEKGTALNVASSLFGGMGSMMGK